MARLGNVLIASAGGSPSAERLKSILVGYDLNVAIADGRETILVKAREEFPDLILIDLDSCSADIMTLSQELGVDPVPLGIVAATLNGQGYDNALAAEIEDIFVGDIEKCLPMARLKPLLRLAGQQREFFRRRSVAEAASGSSLPVPDLIVDDDPRAILFIGESDASRARITDALGDAGGIVGSADLFTAGQWLSEAPFDACVICPEPGDDLEPYQNFCVHIRHNPNLYNLPLIVIDGGPANDADAYAAGVTLVLGGDATLEALRFTLLTHCKRQRRRRALRRAIEATKVPDVTDPVTGAYALSFLSPYLGTMIEAAESRQKYLTMIALSFPSLPNFRQHFGDEAGDQLMRQLAEWTGLLCRPEDVVACFGDHGLCVILPSVPVDEARSVMRRIAGILSHTDFTVHNVFQPVAVELEVGIAEVEPGDTSDRLIQRAWKLTD